MFSSVEILSIDYLSLARGRQTEASSNYPALYVIGAGSVLLSCELASLESAAVPASPIQQSLPSAIPLHVGDVALVTRPWRQRLEGFSGPDQASAASIQVLRIQFDLGPNVQLGLSAPGLIRVQTALLPTPWPEPASWQASATPAPQLAALAGVCSVLIGTIIAPHARRADQASPSRYDSVVSQTLLAMEREPARPWTLERFAEAAGVSRSALAQKFKDQVGKTLSEQLLDVRMQLASQFLKDHRHQLKEIARMTGYQSVSAFSTAYKRWSGSAPSQQRKSIASEF